jgi:DNA mismatch repair ATPase MutS
MEFLTDKQTLNDLEILNRYNKKSLFSFFNQTISDGGDRLLEEMFRRPLTEIVKINERAQVISFFSRFEAPFPLQAELLKDSERFLLTANQKTRISVFGHHLRRKGLFLLGLHEEFNLFENGIKATAAVLKKTNDYLDVLIADNAENPYGTRIKAFRQIYGHPAFAIVREFDFSRPLSFFETSNFGQLFGAAFQKDLLNLFEIIYELDVFIAVGRVARENRFVFAKAYPAEGSFVRIINCRHPALKDATGNHILIDKHKNLFFLTGANMAGKSTLMKSVGCSVYLAHMGFPVAADEMDFSVKDGIFTSINLPDDIGQGYSHFYAEVMRVKTISEQISKRKNLLIIFDELFKGTNVKDAFDATLAVTRALCPYTNSAFIISTHILEVATELKEEKGVCFAYMPTILEENVPKYTYKLTPGVSEDRHGMLIIENEGILSMLAK